MAMPGIRLSVATTLLAVVAAGCGESEDPMSPPSPEVLSLIGGDNQVGVPGAELGSPLIVRVTRPSGGVAGVQVTWRVETGGGVFRPSAVTVTDQSGTTQVHFTPSTHRATVSAAIASAEFSPVRFQTVPATVALYSRVSASTFCAAGPECEKYFFYSDNTFVLRFSSGFEADGTFTRQDSVITLRFRQFSVATAKLRNDSLFVAYDANMSLSDFEDGAFRLEQGTTPGSTAPTGLLLDTGVIRKRRSP